MCCLSIYLKKVFSPGGFIQVVFRKGKLGGRSGTTCFYHLLGRGFYLLYLNPEDEVGDTFDQAEWAGSDFPSFKTKQLLGEGEDICCLALVFTYKPHQRSL